MDAELMVTIINHNDFRGGDASMREYFMQQFEIAERRIMAQVPTAVARSRLIEAMEAEVARWCREPMVWGKDDCVLACANILRDALGYDPAAPWRTGYTDRDGAYETLGVLGLGFALRQTARRHGWKRIDPADARCGDVGLALQNGIPVTLICKAAGWFVGRSEGGATLLPVNNIAEPARSVRIAWSIV